MAVHESYTVKHFHNYTALRCNSNYPFEDNDNSPVCHRAEIKDDTEREREREVRGGQSNEGGRKKCRREKEEGDGESHKENNVLVKC